jgi:hypothetical protein
MASWQNTGKTMALPTLTGILSLVQCFKMIQSLKFLFYNLTPPLFATRCGTHIDMHAVNILYKSCSTAAPGA